MPHELKTKILTGGEASAEAMRQINPDVVPMYPITPQTPIIEKYAGFAAQGRVSTEIIRTESEHSALSAAIGAQAAGARAMTATASVGLAYMWEVLGVASGLRLPIVMSIANRALSAPINIHCDHSDAMGARDQGWLQIFAGDHQEVYELTFLALKLAEKVRLPAMVMQDGFILSHGSMRTTIYSDKPIKKFIGAYRPAVNLLDTDHPIALGAVHLQDALFENKRQLIAAHEHALREFPKIGQELSKITGHRYPHFEEYKSRDAEAVIIILGSTGQIVKTVIDKLRKRGRKVGLIRVCLFRPFPYKTLAKSLTGVKKIAVMDRAAGYGSENALYSEIKSTVGLLTKNKPLVQSYLYGLGGRAVNPQDIEEVFQTLRAVKSEEPQKYINLAV